MPRIDSQTQKLTAELSSYLSETLGGDPKLTPWPAAKRLQHILQDTYHFVEMTIHGKQCVAMIDKLHDELVAKKVGRQIQLLSKTHTDNFVFVSGAMTAAERRRFLTQGTQFIVPGNQMFVPTIGVSLREFYRSRGIKVDQMAPSTQSMLINLLCSRPEPVTKESTRGHNYLLMGQPYGRMTLSRTVRELEALGLISLVDDFRSAQMWGKENDRALAAQKLWEAARPMMKSPVKRVTWLNRLPTCTFASLLTAGEWALSFLASDTMLASPRLPVYAMSESQFDKVMEVGKAFQVDEQDADCEIEIWTYEPKATRWWGPSVDAYSLTMCFEGTQDPRLELALEEIGQSLPGGSQFQ